MTASVLSWLLGTLAVGIVLLVAGLRGKRVGIQPVCRGCGFDLSGVEGTGMCPECGSGLKRARAVRRGLRRRRPLVIVAGGVAILAPVSALAAFGYALYTGVNLDFHKPLAVLEWELERAGAARSRMIAEELLARMANKKTARRDFDRMVDIALARQGDRSRRWSQEWGDIITEADVALRLDKDRLERFKRQAAILEVRARPRVRLGDPIPVVIDLAEGRVGRSSDMMTGVDLVGASIAGKEISVPTSKVRAYGPDQGYIAVFSLAGGAMARMWYGYTAGGTELKVPDGVAPGRHILKLRFSVDTSSGRMGVLIPRQAKKPPEIGNDLECWIPVEIVEEDTIIAQTPSDEVKRAVEYQLEPIRVMRSTGQDQYRATGTTILFNIADLPVDVDFDVELRSGSSRWSAGRLTSGQGMMQFPQQEILYFIGGGGSERTLYVGGNVTGDTVDVVLKPNPKAAAKTVDLDLIYGAEIVYKDVEVSKPVARR